MSDKNALSLSDHSTRRDDSGNRLPGWQTIDFLGGEAEVLSMTKSQKQRVQDALEEMDDADDDEEIIPSSLSADIFSDVVLTPDPADDSEIAADDYTEEYVDEDMHDDLEIGLWVAVFRESGMSDQAEFFEAIGSQDPDQLSEMVEKAETLGKLEGMGDEEAQT